MEKVALGFAVLHGRTHGFDLQHWHMAELFMAHSDAVRDGVLAAIATDAQRARSARARAEGAAEVERDAAKHSQLLERVRSKVLVRLTEAAPGSVAGANLKRSMSREQRVVFDDALAGLMAERLIERRVRSSGGTAGAVYRLGAEGR